MEKEICFNCGEEIVGEKILFMPGKIPGAVKIPIVESIPDKKHPEGLERITGYKWEARGKYPLQYQHLNGCP